MGFNRHQQSSGNPDYPRGWAAATTGKLFDKAGIPVLYVEATNWALGQKDGATSSGLNRRPSRTGSSWHNVMLDNQQHIDRLAAAVEHRSRDVVKVMLPLVEDWRKRGKPGGRLSPVAATPCRAIWNRQVGPVSATPPGRPSPFVATRTRASARRIASLLPAMPGSPALVWVSPTDR